jgi:hypothetical protein
MNIPGATCCPNGELAYRVRRLVPDTTTPIVINCAGRTRSIIGAQTLINLGLPNPVYALENGTQGWYLNDHKLGHGGTQRYAADSGNTDLRPAAKALAERFDVPTVPPRPCSSGLRRRAAPCSSATCARPRSSPPAASPARSTRPAAS